MTITQVKADRAELKISFRSTQVPTVRRQLDLDPQGKMGDVFFLEDLTIGVGLPLLEAGVILRIRKARSGAVKTTVKLRPARASQLEARWIEPAAGLRLEQDRGLSQAVLAASLDGQVEKEAFELVQSGAEPVHTLFNPAQHDLLADCSPLRINIDQLQLVGPITSERWEDIRLAPFDDAEIEVERWAAEGLEFIEVSAKVRDVDGAGAAQLRLGAALGGLGLIPHSSRQTKTGQMLEHLAAVRQDSE